MICMISPCTRAQVDTYQAMRRKAPAENLAGRLCGRTLRDNILQSFMRRVHAEKAYRNIIPGSRVKQILLELCAPSRDLPAQHNRLQNIVMGRRT